MDNRPPPMNLTLPDLNYIQKHFDELYKENYCKILMSFEDDTIITLYRYKPNGNYTITSWDEYNLQLILDKRL